MLLLTHAETQTGQCINKTKVQIQNSSMPSSVSMWPMRSRCPNEFPRVSDTLAEKAWEGAAQGIGKILVHVTFLKTKLIFASSVKTQGVLGRWRVRVVTDEGALEWSFLLVYSTSIFLLYLIILPQKKIIQKNAFSRIGAMIWNKMPNGLRQRFFIKYFENQRHLYI